MAGGRCTQRFVVELRWRTVLLVLLSVSQDGGGGADERTQIDPGVPVWGVSVHRLIADVVNDDSVAGARKVPSLSSKVLPFVSHIQRVLDLEFSLNDPWNSGSLRELFRSRSTAPVVSVGNPIP
jgi:hypothetical protein